ncbi:MAG: pyruvate kinase [Deltaproteobacteria bacterium]
MLLPNRTKIVATLGPASDSDEVLAQLIRAGTNVFRINCSHSDHAGIVDRIHTVRRVANACNAQIGVLADLQGPKIRIGRLKNEEPIWLKPGAPLIIVSDKTVVGEDAKPGEVIRVGTSYELLCKDVKPGERILIDDGNLEVLVEKISGRDVHTSVVYGGLLKQYKGINLPGTDVSAEILTEKDLGDLKVALEHNVDFVALSFVRRAGDLRLLGKYIREANSNARMISKIERPEAIENLEEIIDESYGVMVARGDMGVELGAEAVPSLQKRMIKLSLAASKPVITATQMLESMITNPRPTRAEASDVANAIYDGTSAVMLSAETASGKYPVRTVEIMSSIIRRTEEDVFSQSRYAPGAEYSDSGRSVTTPRTDIALATARAGAYAALEAGAKVIAVFTDSGQTARHLSGERMSTRVWAFTPHDETVQRLALSWGINARKIAKSTNSQEETLEGERILLREGIVQPGDRIVVVFGTTREAGMTNVMHIRTL